MLPILGRLHTEIKHKNKEISSGAGKGSKAVSAARNVTQKHIELLGQHSAAFNSSGGKVDSSNDPYVIQRGIQHRLHKQVLEENNNRDDLIAVQRNFEVFEAHVLKTIQQALAAFLQVIGGQSDLQKGMYSDMISTAQRIPPEFEWMNFLHRNGNLMIDPSAPKRMVSSITFPNQNHTSTQPLIAGTLERKSRAIGALTGYKTGYYAVTPSKYLHQFDDDDNFHKDPTPNLSLYLPDCTIGAVAGEKFNVKGKDASKGKVGSTMAMSHEFQFKAHTPADAEKWWNVIRDASGGNASSSLPTSPTSPVENRNFSGSTMPPQYAEKQAPPLQTQGLAQGTGPTSAGPGSAAPVSAGGLHSAGPQSAQSKTGGPGV